jgi:hypothetical protein
MPSRSLTTGEKEFLRPIFGATLPYDTQIVATNDHNLGGSANSITPNGTPYFSTQIYVADFTDSAVSDGNKWIFIHEFAHVWQKYHHINPIVGAFVAWAEAFYNYDQAYYYDFSISTNFGSWTIESQASIVADYWYVTKSKAPQYNRGADKSLATYQGMIKQVQNSGPPAIS